MRKVVITFQTSIQDSEIILRTAYEGRFLNQEIRGFEIAISEDVACVCVPATYLCIVCIQNQAAAFFCHAAGGVGSDLLKRGHGRLERVGCKLGTNGIKTSRPKSRKPGHLPAKPGNVLPAHSARVHTGMCHQPPITALRTTRAIQPVILALVP